jgi:hypothetical protein
MIENKGLVARNYKIAFSAGLRKGQNIDEIDIKKFRVRKKRKNKDRRMKIQVRIENIQDKLSTFINKKKSK